MKLMYLSDESQTGQWGISEYSFKVANFPMLFVLGQAHTTTFQTPFMELLKCLQLLKSEECYNFTLEFGGIWINLPFYGYVVYSTLRKETVHLMEVALHCIVVKTSSKCYQLSYKGELKGVLYK